MTDDTCAADAARMTLEGRHLLHPQQNSPLLRELTRLSVPVKRRVSRIFTELSVYFAASCDLNCYPSCAFLF